MAPKIDNDPVTAEYDVYLTPAMSEQIYLLQYPNRPRSRPYSQASGATPHEMRIKPKSGYLEMDVKLSTQHNFNKSMGLRWGEATRASKQLHNLSGTFGPAAGLAMARPRAGGRGGALKDKMERDLEVDHDLHFFQDAERDNKVFNTQTLGGQIIRHDGEDEVGKPFYFVGAFEGDQLHLSKVTGTVQMRPQFHHLDAEEERNRIAASRAQADAGEGGPAPIARALQARFMQEDEKDSLEARMKKLLQAAEQEQWIDMEYVDEEDDEAFQAFHDKLFVRDVDTAPVLKSGMDNDAYLDAVSAPRRESPTRRRKRAPKRKDIVDVDDDDVNNDDDDDDAEDNEVEDEYEDTNMAGT